MWFALVRLGAGYLARPWTRSSVFKVQQSSISGSALLLAGLTAPQLLGRSAGLCVLGSLGELPFDFYSVDGIGNPVNCLVGSLKAETFPFRHC